MKKRLGFLSLKLDEYPHYFLFSFLILGACISFSYGKNAHEKILFTLFALLIAIILFVFIVILLDGYQSYCQEYWIEKAKSVLEHSLELEILEGLQAEAIRKIMPRIENYCYFKHEVAESDYPDTLRRLEKMKRDLRIS